MLDTLFKGSDVTYKVTLGESGSLLTGPMKALLCGVGIDRRQARGPLLPLPGSYFSHLPVHGFRLSLISQAVVLKGAFKSSENGAERIATEHLAIFQSC